MNAVPSPQTAEAAAASPLWIVLDARTAQNGIDSGIARYVVGLAKGLCAALSAGDTSVPPASCRILLVSRDGPAQWAIELVERYPALAAHWSGTAGRWSASLDKPAFVWSSAVLPLISAFTGGRFLWIAPANLDRPVLLGWRGPGVRERVFQVIHDLLPFQHPKSMGLFFRTHFRSLVRRTLARMPVVVTVSAHSAGGMSAVAKREVDVRIVPCAVDESFGTETRPVPGSAGMAEARLALLQRIFANQSIDENVLKALVPMAWFLMVGRPQGYKAWSVAEAALKAHQERNPASPILTIRVGFDAAEGRGGNPGSALALMHGSYLPLLRQLNLRRIPNSIMSELFRVSNALLHPSQGEGFGLPPIEAAFSGCPVIYRAGTAVDAHFRPGALPRGFWMGVDDDEIDSWTAAIAEVLAPAAETRSFLTQLSALPQARAFIESRCAAGHLTWESSARLLLERIVAPRLRPELS